MPGSSVRSRTPRLRTPSLGVDVWAISSAGCVSMDDMQLLYSCPIRWVAASYMHDDQSEAVMMRWGLIRSWAEGQSASLPTGKRHASARMTELPQMKSYQLTSLPPVQTATDVLGKDHEMWW